MMSVVNTLVGIRVQGQYGCCALIGALSEGGSINDLVIE